MESEEKRVSISKKILIITDDRGYLCGSLNEGNENSSADVNTICKEFKKLGWKVIVRKYSDINKKEIFKNYFVIYASMEDYGQFYKDYIEDILLWLKLYNNILLPDFNFFRAHHNKMYMELLRRFFEKEQLTTIKSIFFSSYKELTEYLKENIINYPVVVKASAGAGSKGVVLARNKRELENAGKRFSKRIYYDYYANIWRGNFFQFLKNFYRSLRRIKKVTYRKKSGKFIVQNFIKNLNCDYKVLIFGNKYFVLKRLNRKNDFRASGSGNFKFPEKVDEIKEILEFGKFVATVLNQPMLSLDIAFDGEKSHLIEFQAVSFGPYALEKSKWHFEDMKNSWEKIEGEAILEHEIAEAIHYYVGKNFENII